MDLFLVVWKFYKRLSTELSVNKYCCCRVGLEGNYHIRTYTIIGWNEYRLNKGVSRNQSKEEVKYYDYTETIKLNY